MDPAVLASRHGAGDGEPRMGCLGQNDPGIPVRGGKAAAPCSCGSAAWWWGTRAVRRRSLHLGPAPHGIEGRSGASFGAGSDPAGGQVLPVAVSDRATAAAVSIGCVVERAQSGKTPRGPKSSLRPRQDRRQAEVPYAQWYRGPRIAPTLCVIAPGGRTMTASAPRPTPIVPKPPAPGTALPQPSRSAVVPVCVGPSCKWG
jgi:hypothetical protein